MTKTMLAMLMTMLVGCARGWEPTPLADGYQIMVMNSKEVYVADAQRELIVGPTIEAIGLAPGIIVVDCGTEARVVNGFANTVGFNLIDTKTGVVTKGLTKADIEGRLQSLGSEVPTMRPLASFLR